MSLSISSSASPARVSRRQPRMQQTAQQDRVKPNPWELDITPATLRKVSAITFFAWVISVYDFTLFGTLLPVIAEDFGWTTAQSTTINTVAQVGVFLVSLVVGPL